MATEIRPEIAGLRNSPLGDELAENACSFEFFQAVTLLERLSAGLRPVGGFSNPEEEAVHFRVNPRWGCQPVRFRSWSFVSMLRRR
jgi:predicted component of type VI protein secretion system